MAVSASITATVRNPPDRARARTSRFLRETAVYDHPDVQKSFGRSEGEHVREAALILEGITRAACVWLSEHHLARLPGVKNVQVNHATHRLRAYAGTSAPWAQRIFTGRHGDRLPRPSLLIPVAASCCSRTGAQTLVAPPRARRRHDPGAGDDVGRGALHLGTDTGAGKRVQRFLPLVSLLLTLPVLLYSAQPFFRGAWNDLKHLRYGMDVPVVLVHLGRVQRKRGIHIHPRGCGLLRLGDHVRVLPARRPLLRATRVHPRGRGRRVAGARAVPATATRLVEGGAEETVPVAELKPGDTGAGTAWGNRADRWHR